MQKLEAYLLIHTYWDCQRFKNDVLNMNLQHKPLHKDVKYVSLDRILWILVN